MRRRQAFTLVELMVSMALIVIILMILAEAFAVGQAAFTSLKAIGDMDERMRTVTSLLRRDLAADHFYGNTRVSDPTTYTSVNDPIRGFFHVEVGNADAGTLVFPGGLVGPQPEGADGDGITSTLATSYLLHFSVKLRGNNRDAFFSAVNVPETMVQAQTSITPELSAPEARYQNPPPTPAPATGIYKSQWAEVSYFVWPNGATAGTAPLYNLYRSQFALVGDGTAVNYGTTALTGTAQQYPGMSTPPPPTALFFNSPLEIGTGTNRAFQCQVDPHSFALPIANPHDRVVQATLLLLTDVVSFDVQYLSSVLDNATTTPVFQPLTTSFDTGTSKFGITALQITLRVWDVKTQQTRQVTIVQDMH